MNQVLRIADKVPACTVRVFVVTFLALLVGACAASRETYQTQLAGWVGKTKAELVQQFGPPERSEKVGDGKEILSWVSSSEMSQGTSAPVGDGFSIGISMTSDYICKLSFTLVDGTAASFDWEFYAHSLLGKIKPLSAGECDTAFPATPRE